MPYVITKQLFNAHFEFEASNTIKKNPKTNKQIRKKQNKNGHRHLSALIDNCTEFSDFIIFIINTRVKESGQNLSIQMTRLEKPELNDCEDH